MQEDIQKAHEQAVHKAALMEQLVRGDGWKVLIELFETLYQQEVGALVGHKLNNDHYRKIGMMQALEYIKAVPTPWKEKEVIQYLLHQGRAKGFQLMMKAPQYFFEGRAFSKEQMNRIYGDEKMSPEDYHKGVYQQEG